MLMIATKFCVLEQKRDHENFDFEIQLFKIKTLSICLVMFQSKEDFGSISCCIHFFFGCNETEKPITPTEVSPPCGQMVLTRWTVMTMMEISLLPQKK